MKCLLICLFLVLLTSCSGMGSGMGLKGHKPALDSTLEIAKRDGTFRIVSIKAQTPALQKILDKDLMTCQQTTFSMPRGNTVGSFIREVFENELETAKKLSINGNGINVIVKALDSDTSKLENGFWKIIIEYVEDEKSTTIETTTSYESKFGLLSACVNTANVFEEALADNLVEYFKRTAAK